MWILILVSLRVQKSLNRAGDKTERKERMKPMIKLNKKENRLIAALLLIVLILNPLPTQVLMVRADESVKTDTDFSFGETEDVIITYYDGLIYRAKQIQTSVSGGNAGATVTYSSSDETIARVSDAATGKFSILRSGTVTISATQSAYTVSEGDATVTYGGATASYRLTVEKGTQTLEFEQVAPADFIYGSAVTFENPVKEQQGIQYSIVEGNNIASVDGNGVLSFLDGQTGTVTVEASRVSDDQYDYIPAQYSLNVKWQDAPAVTHTFVDEEGKTVNTDEWITGDLFVCPPEGWQISDSNSIAADHIWSDRLPVTQQGSSVSIPAFYLQKEDGGITAPIASDIVKIDRDAPSNLTITYSDPQSSQTGQDGFSYYDQQTNPLQVTLEAQDAVSGVEAFRYYYDESGESPFGTIDASKVGDKYQAVLPIQEEYRGKLYFDAIDVAGNKTAIVGGDRTVIVDGTRPRIKVTYDYATEQNGIKYCGKEQELAVTVTEKNFDAAKVELNLLAYDAGGNSVSMGDIEGLADTVHENGNWSHSEDGNTHTFTIPLAEDASYELSVGCEDLSGNKAEPFSDRLVIDKVAPEAEYMSLEDRYDLDSCIQMVDREGNPVTDAAGSTGFIYSDEAVFSFAIREAHFDPEKVVVTVERDGVQLSNGDGYRYNASDWKKDTSDPDLYTLKLPVGKADGKFVDGDYQISIQCTDLAGKEMAPYTSQIMSIDTTEPVICVSYDNENVTNGTYYNAARRATIVVEDRNLTSGDILTTVTAKDVTGAPVAFDLTGRQSAWKRDNDSNTWTSTVIFDQDADYTVSIACEDLAGHTAVAYDAHFVVDKTAPDPADFRIEYSTPLAEKLLSGITFGFYNPKVTVKITAKDMTSPIDHFVWSYEKQAGAGSANVSTVTNTITRDQIVYSNGSSTATAEFTLTATEAAQYRGSILYNATDMAGNTSANLTDSNTIVVVDTISPTRTVTYSPAKQVVSKSTLQTLGNFSSTNESTEAILYYDAPMTMTFRIKEENFFAEDVVIKVNGNQVTATDWKQNGDEWTGTLNLSEDNDYIVTLEYMDKSQNKMQTYTSSQITVDTKNPAVSVEYSPNNTVQQIDNIRYYSQNQTVRIVVTERNFRAEDIEVKVTATNAAGENTGTQNYADYLRNRSNWVTEGDKHTATISFAADGNYTLAVSYRDLALRTAETPVNTLTVDTTAPGNPVISYSTPVLEAVLERITFGFYKAPVTVTVTAEDVTSGINRMVYSYIKESGVSDVNAEVREVTVGEGDITFSNGRKTATATFQVPGSALNAGNQFNGHLEVTAFDRSGMSTKYVDGRRVIVDNIAPNISVEYNNSVKEQNGISYYDGEIQAAITVMEANFYEEDVKVSVARNGGEASPVSVSWSSQSADRHTGTFTLKEEGDYIVSVTYTDRSGNEAAVYQSAQMTIDTTKPVITVSGIRNHSANRGEQIGLEIIVDDINLDGATVSTQLLASILDENGTVQEVDLSELGEVAVTAAGTCYSYTVTNLETDAIYSLSCTAGDMSGNISEELSVQGAGNETVDSMLFSVNRHGSTYILGEETRALNGSFAQAPVDIEISEVNPDELGNIKLTLFKNDKTIELQQDKDYAVKLEGGNGSWYCYHYTVYDDNFMDDGVYRLSVYSEDAAGNISENTLDVKDMEISFGIDKTAPNLILTNLEKNTTYPVENLTVVMQATDNIKLSSVEVFLDGREHAVWNQEDMEQNAGNTEDFTFDIAGDVTEAHTVEVILTDLAGNRTVETVDHVYVTTNILVRLLHSSLLPIGCAVAVGSSGIIVFAGIRIRVGRRRRA